MQILYSSISEHKSEKRGYPFHLKDPLERRQSSTGGTRRKKDAHDSSNEEEEGKQFNT